MTNQSLFSTFKHNIFLKKLLADVAKNNIQCVQPPLYGRNIADTA